MASVLRGTLFAGRRSWILEACYIGEHLLNSRLDSIPVYTDDSIKNLGLLCACGSAATYFPNVDTGVEIKMDGLLSLTLTEMQAIALALECVPISHLVDLYTDSQALLNICISTSSISGPDFHNKCWIEKEHIHHVIARKNLSVMWNKVKGHSGVIENECADFYANIAVIFKSFLPIAIPYRFLIVEGRSVFGNTCYFAKKLFNAVYTVGWEARCVDSVIGVGLNDHFDKARTFCV
ncbi:hypothetical protein G9A89_009676 [Geosiphon pyriformis]|nr:hypothetical protein G9A89_009676 [Geosiphon pyriformis]